MTRPALARQRVGLLAGILFCLLVLLLPEPAGMPDGAQAVAAVACLMATWWLTEAVPIAATALLPMVLFPLLGVASSASVAPAYAHHLVFLFLGGFLLAAAIQRWGLHRRIALHAILVVGTSPRQTVLGFMLAAALLSMWISNTATAMMMLPIAIAVIEQLREFRPADREEDHAFATALMLGIAYAASIGGVATLIGTPPNAILAGMLETLYGIEIGFARWFILGLPLSLLMLAITWFYLTRVAFKPCCERVPGLRESVTRELAELGPPGPAERRVLTVFGLVATAWMSHGLLPFETLAGIADSSIAVCGAIALFALPAGDAGGSRLLDWNSASRIPWEILILFGGGFALAQGFADSGLTQWLVARVEFPPGTVLFWVILSVTLAVIFLTEITSNTATATIVIPLVGALASAVQAAPVLLMLPAAIAASYAFMLPVATPPNAIVFSSGRVSMLQMARCGLWLNLVAALMISGLVTVLQDWLASW